jgi:hypothetical protein
VSVGRREEIEAEAIEMANAFEKGEPFFSRSIPYAATPDETPEDVYWKQLAQMLHHVTPELAAIAFEGKGALHGPARAHFLLSLWEKVHDRLHALPEQEHTLNLVPLPVAKETTAEWHARITKEKTSLNPSPSLDPKQS